MKEDPTCDLTGSRCFLLSQTLKGYNNLDPPTTHQKAIPFCLLETMFYSTSHSSSSIKHAVSQLSCGAFFHGMRSCEYSKTCSKEESKRTKILVLKNFRFFKENRLLHTINDLHILPSADFIYITFVFQKNNERNDSVGMYKTDDPTFCPVILWASVIKRILSYPLTCLDTQVNVWFDQKSNSLKYITSNMIRSQLRGTAAAIGKALLGFDPKEIGCHSIRSGFAMAMYLTKELPLTIMIIGRWLSEAFLKYIRKQVAMFSHNVSKRMIQNRSFYTVPNYDQTLSSIPSNLKNVTIDGCQDKGLFDSRNFITPNRNPNQTR